MPAQQLLDSLIEEQGWEGVLGALIQIADRDDFEIMAGSLRPLLQLITGSQDVGMPRSKNQSQSRLSNLSSEKK